MSRATKPLSQIFKILNISIFLKSIFNNFFLQNFPPQNHNFQQNVQYVRGQWLINICTKFQVDIFQIGWDMA